MFIIVAIMILSIYMACPLVGKIALLVANSIIPDAIPFVDELIMWIGLFSHLVRLMRVSEFVSAHKKTIRLFVCLFVGFAIGFIVVCFFV